MVDQLISHISPKIIMNYGNIGNVVKYSQNGTFNYSINTIITIIHHNFNCNGLMYNDHGPLARNVKFGEFCSLNLCIIRVADVL